MEPAKLEKLEQTNGINLPDDHRALLCESNGCEAYGGYVRLFGFGDNEAIDSGIWNHIDYWKFAWGGRCSNFWCFAETAWGDQYAYALNALKAGRANVFLLDHASMTATLIASSFSEFMSAEFLRIAREPYDQMTVLARQKLGDLEVSDHLVYILSLVLGGQDDIRNVDKMNARAAMIANGDVAIQVDNAPNDAVLERLETYDDEHGRTRIRLVWR